MPSFMFSIATLLRIYRGPRSPAAILLLLNHTTTQSVASTSLLFWRIVSKGLEWESSSSKPFRTASPFRRTKWAMQHKIRDPWEAICNAEYSISSCRDANVKGTDRPLASSRSFLANSNRHQRCKFLVFSTHVWEYRVPPFFVLATFVKLH
jgi:hypothetical protein